MSLVWAEATVFWYSCVYNSVVSKSKRVAGLKLGILREKVVLYKTGKFLPHPAGGEAASRVGPKIVLDHVRMYIYIYIYIYICLCALGFLTIGCIRCYWQRIFVEGYED